MDDVYFHESKSSELFIFLLVISLVGLLVCAIYQFNKMIVTIFQLVSLSQYQFCPLNVDFFFNKEKQCHCLLV